MADDSDDDFFPLVALAYLIETSTPAPRRPRRLPFMTGIQWVEEKMQDPKQFYDMFRMRRSVFHMLHDTLVNNYQLESSPYMSSREALALFLWTCGSPQSNSNGASRFEHSASTISVRFAEVLKSIDRMAGDYVKPRDPAFNEVHDRLRKPRFWPHFKDAIGAIDGTHIRVVVPTNLKVVHTNRHGYTSQNVMAVCDFDMRFTFVVTGWPGSVHDTRVWSDAVVEYPHYPHPPGGKYYLVDSGYPNRIGYLAPFKGQRYHVPEFQQAVPVGMREVFNHRHSSLRNVIERSFGVLKMKWRILEGIPSYPVEKQKMIISACMCLHNFIRDSALRDEHFERFERGEYVLQDGPPPNVEGYVAPIEDGTMGQIRDAIAAGLVA